jgi:hypothetical protein
MRVALVIVELAHHGIGVVTTRLYPGSATGSCRLAELNLDAYGEWTFRDLAAALADAELRPVKIRGNMFVRAADVTDAHRA